MALLGFIAVGWAWAEAPMELKSPFPKVALLKNSNGTIEEREIQWAKLVGDSVEMETIKGSMALFPRGDVVAILPRLPTGSEGFKPSDIDLALAFLGSLPAPLSQRPEASSESLKKWRDLRKLSVEEYAKLQQEEKTRERERIKQEESKVSEWLMEATDFHQARSKSDLEKINGQGNQFLEQKVGDEAKVRDGLGFLAQMVAKEKGGPLPELAKVNEIQAQLVPEDLLVWVTLGILLLSFCGLVFGLSFLSSGLTRMRGGALLGGIVFGGVGLAILSSLALVWWPAGGQGEPMTLAISSKMEKIVTCSKNSVKSVYYFPSMEFDVSGEEFASGILGSLAPMEEAVGFLKGKLQQGELWGTQGRFVWRQPVVALGIPLPVSFVFKGKNPSAESWQKVELDQVFLGKVMVPEPVGSLLCEAMKSTMQNGLNSGGFSRISIKPGKENHLIVVTASSGKKPELAGPIANFASSAYRREITAEDLAKKFVDNKGGEFHGKFVVIEGVVDKISSGGEYSGIQNAGQGVGVGNENRPAKIKSDMFDIFYLRAMDSYGYRNDTLFIKVIVKSPDVFVMDTYGDIYKGPSANTVKDKPFIKKGYRVKFLNEGRVQSDQIKNNEIEVYGVEVSGEGDVLCFDPSAPPPN